MTILDTFTMKRTTTMRKFHLNGSSYTLYTEKVIQIMIHFIKKIHTSGTNSVIYNKLNGTCVSLKISCLLWIHFGERCIQLKFGSRYWSLQPVMFNYFMVLEKASVLISTQRDSANIALIVRFLRKSSFCYIPH